MDCDNGIEFIRVLSVNEVVKRNGSSERIEISHQFQLLCFLQAMWQVMSEIESTQCAN